MPIVFEAAQPLDPRAAASAGRLNARSQIDAEETRRMSIYADLAARGAELQSRSGLAGVEMQSRERMQREQSAQQLQEQATQVGINNTRVGMQESIAAAEMQNRLAVRKLDFQLDQQALTRKEQGELVQLQSAFKGIDNDPNLTANQKYELKSLMGPKISRLMAQEAVSKKHFEEEQVKGFRMKNELAQTEQARAEAFQAAQMNNSFNFEPDPTAVPELEREVSALYNIPSGSPEFKKKVDQLARERGLGYRWFPTKSGRQIHPADENRLKAGGQKEKDEAKMQEVALKQADSIRKSTNDYIKTVTDATGSPPSDEQVQKHIEQQVRISAAVEKSLGIGRKDEEPPEVRMANEVATVSNFRDRTLERTDLPDQVKQIAKENLDQAAQLIQSFKPGSRSKEVQARIKNLVDGVKMIVERAAPAGVSSSAKGQGTAPTPTQSKMDKARAAVAKGMAPRTAMSLYSLTASEAAQLTRQ